MVDKMVEHQKLCFFGIGGIRLYEWCEIILGM